MGVSDISTILVTGGKVIGKHNQFIIVHAKVENLHEKVNAFKARLHEMFKRKLPSF